jgi:hypothetical protein
VTGTAPNPKLRARIETLIGVMAPALDLALAVGDRLSRLLTREDPAYVTARMERDGESAPRGLRGRPD